MERAREQRQAAAAETSSLQRDIKGFDDRKVRERERERERQERVSSKREGEGEKERIM